MPRSTCDFTVTMQAQRTAPPDMQLKDKFLVQSTVVPFGSTDEDITTTTFSKESGNFIEEFKLRVTLVSPPHSPVLQPSNGASKQEAADESPRLKPASVFKESPIVKEASSFKNEFSDDKNFDPSHAKEVEDLKSKITVLESKLLEKALAGLRRINLEGLRWRLFDAKGQVLGRLASQIATVIQGKDKPTYTPYREDGDMCIVLNAKDICVTGRKMTNKFFRWHTGYVGHLKERSLKDQMAKDPTEVIRKAVLRMLPRNKLRDDRDRKLRIFTGSEHLFGDRLLEPYEMPPRQVREMRPHARRALIRAQKKAEQSSVNASAMASNKEDNRA